MSRLPILPIAWTAGLLCASILPCQARELTRGDPVRTALVDLARHTPVTGLPSDAGLSLSRVWVEGGRGTVCAVARRADGELLVQDSGLQMKRLALRQRGSKWAVERAERVSMGPNMTIDTACQQQNQRTPEVAVASAIRQLEQNPPAAGMKVGPLPLSARCVDNGSPAPRANMASAGVVALAGRSLLHTAPDARCLMGKHIVQGDKVAILAQKPGWSQVRYVHPITQVVTVGWLQSGRVKPVPNQANVANTGSAPAAPDSTALVP